MTNGNIKVSIIVPVFNAEKYLEDCLNCLCHQTLQEIEIIAINDGSNDRSQEILENYAQSDSRFVIINQANSGAALARNKGIEKAKGKWLWFADADDLCSLEMAEKLYNYGESHNNDIVVCKADIIDIGNKQSEMSISLAWEKIKFINDFSLDMVNDFSFTSFTVWNKLYRKDFVLSKKLRFQPLSSCNDVAFCLISLSEAKRIGIVSESLYVYRYNAKGNITSNRGKYAENSLLAADYVRRELMKREKWSQLSDSFYQCIVRSLFWEYKLASWKQKMKLRQKIYQFLPIEYFKAYFGRKNHLLNFLFSQTQKGNKHIIKICGIKISFKNTQQQSTKFLRAQKFRHR